MLLKTITLSCCAMLMFCIGAAGNTKTVTYSVESKNTVSASGDIPEGSAATYAQTYKTKYQITAGHSSSLTLDGFDRMTITGITLLMKSNRSSGAGSLAVTCGTSTLAEIPDSKFDSSDWNGEYPEFYTKITPKLTPYTVASGESVNIVIKATENSLYCQSFTITYSDEFSKVGTPTFSLASGEYIGVQHVTLGFPKDNTASHIMYTTDGSEPSTDNIRTVVTDAETEILVKSPVIIKAVATNSSNDRSATVSRSYNVFLPDKTTRTALACVCDNTTYAMSADDLKAVAIDAVNGMIINADDELASQLSWTVYEAGDSAVIGNDHGQYLSGGDTQSLSLSGRIFKWAAVHENSSWQNSDRTFLFGSTADGNFCNYPIDDIDKGGNQADCTKPYSFAEGYVRSGLHTDQLATVCLPCDVAEHDFCGASVFEIIGVVKSTPNMEVNDITGIAVKPVTQLSAGTPYLMQATNNSFVAAYSGETVTETTPATGLAGNLNDTKVSVEASNATHWIYVVYNNEFRKVTNTISATIAANRAYINLYGVPMYSGNDNSVKTIPLSGSSTRISPLSSADKPTNIYLPNGQKATSVYGIKGIYIVNGRKYKAE